MKLLAAMFAGIALLAALPGFAMNLMPILSLFGQAAAVAGLIGFTVTALACAMETPIQSFEFEPHEVHA